MCSQNVVAGLEGGGSGDTFPHQTKTTQDQDTPTEQSVKYSNTTRNTIRILHCCLV